MTLKQIFDVKNNRLIIDLPKSFKDIKKVMVTVEDEINEREIKILLLKQASGVIFIIILRIVNQIS